MNIRYCVICCSGGTAQKLWKNSRGEREHGERECRPARVEAAISASPAPSSSSDGQRRDSSCGSGRPLDAI